MKKVLVTFLIICAAFSAQATGTESSATEVIGFGAWKTTRVEEARATLDRIQAETIPERGIPSQDKPELKKGVANPSRVQKGGKGESRLQQAQINLEVATELTIDDYFVLYLSQIKSESAILEAAKKLSVDEVAQLMTAYKKQLEGRRSAIGMLPPTLQNVRPTPTDRSATMGL